MKLMSLVIVVVFALLAAALVVAQTISVPSFMQLDPDVSLAVQQYPEAIIPALNTQALAVQAELAALGSDTDIADAAALSVRAAAKQQACNNLQVALAEASVPQDSSVWKDLAFLEELRIDEADALLFIVPEGKTLWIYTVEPSPQTGNAYWYRRQLWETVRSYPPPTFKPLDRIECRRIDGMTASYLMSIEELKSSDMWGAV